MCVFVSICTRARGACVYACLCERMCGFVRFHRIAPPRVCSKRVCAPRRCARPPIARRRLAVCIARPAPRVAAARVVAFGATGRTRARSAAGVTWTCRTASAPWAGRSYGHTSVVDAAGATGSGIYVIGGTGSVGGELTFYNDVWVSSDGGVRAALGRGGYSRGYLRGTTGVLRSTKGYKRVV